MKKKEEMTYRQALGVILHFGHIFSGYNILEIAEFSKGLVMGITIALDLAGKVKSDKILPTEEIGLDQGLFGIEQILRAFFFAKFFDRSALKDPIDEFNTLDLSDLIAKARKEMLVFGKSKRPFFVDPGNKNKQ